MNLNKASEKDLKAVWEIEKQSFDKNIYSESSLLKELKNNSVEFLVLKKQNLLIGYIIMQISVPEAEILKIAVHRKFRQQGYGDLILKKAEEFCKKRGVTDIFLEVSDKNFIAIKLYQKHNFEQIFIRDNYYEDFSNAICLKKRLV